MRTTFEEKTYENYFFFTKIECSGKNLRIVQKFLNQLWLPVKISFYFLQSQILIVTQNGQTSFNIATAPVYSFLSINGNEYYPNQSYTIGQTNGIATLTWLNEFELENNDNLILKRPWLKEKVRLAEAIMPYS